MKMNLTIKKIIEIVDESKDLSRDEQIQIAYSLPMTACGLYVIEMKRRHGKVVPI
jgi:hypothetical protein